MHVQHVQNLFFKSLFRLYIKILPSHTILKIVVIKPYLNILIFPSLTGLCSILFHHYSITTRDHHTTQPLPGVWASSHVKPVPKSRYDIRKISNKQQ